MTKKEKPMNLGSPVSHLLIDLDGTLLGNRSVSLSLDFAKKALSTLQPFGGWRKNVRTLLTINELFKRKSAHLTNDSRVVRFFSKEMHLSLEDGRRVLRNALQVVFPGLKQHFYPIAGAKEFLDWAKTRWTLTLATNPVWPAEIIKLRVEWAGIDPAIFSFITTARAMHACKPEPEYFDEILRLQSLRAEDCLFIGNDVKMDLPATRVGIRTFIVSDTKRLASLQMKGTKAPAWSGNYDHLRSLLSREREDISPK